MTLKNERVLFIDCQSTGANPRTGNLLEVGWCCGSAEESSAITSMLIKQPDAKAIPSRIRALTGITCEDMEAAVEAKLALEAIQKELATISGGKSVAHFASFERNFLGDLFERHGSSKSPLDFICTYEISRRLLPNLPTNGIRGIGAFFGSTPKDLKRSVHHVETTLAIWRGIVEDLERLGIFEFNELHEWLKQPRKKKTGNFEFPLPAKKRLALPQSPGIYRMLNQRGEILYIGKATSLKSRVNSYFTGKKGKESRKLEMAMQVHDIDFVECGSALEAAILESDEIKKHNPPYNVSLKTGMRKLAFFSRDFMSVSETQSDDFPLGPFSSEFVLDQFIALLQCVENRIADPEIFYGEIPNEELAKGFKLFCERNNINNRRIYSARQLMASALRVFRNLPTGEDESNSELHERNEPPEEAYTEKLEPANRKVIAANVESISLSAEEVADKFERILIRAAKAYLRSKMLTRLLNCNLTFKEGDVDRHLRLRNGIVKVSSAKATESHEGDLDATWKNCDISTYDRLSVLLSEMDKLRTRGVKINHVPENAI
jgi:DNA polymerase-3 subunit epsilon